DGIRGFHVTGVQTCALPIYNVFQINPHLFLDNAIGVNMDYAIMNGETAYNGFRVPTDEKFQEDLNGQLHYSIGLGIKPRPDKGRSEERRVGKECRCEGMTEA